MATWEDMMNPNYSSVTTVRDRHQALMDKRQAENMARMQAANPGYLPGGQMPGQSQGFQRFGPPTVMSNQDEWLKTQFAMADEHLGGAGDPAATAQAAQAAATGGMGNAGQGGGELGGNRGGSPNDPLGFNDFGPNTGLSPGLAAVGGFLLGPQLSPLMGGLVMTEDQQQQAINEWGNFNAPNDPVVGAFNALGDFTKESQLADNPDGFAKLPGVGLPNKDGGKGIGSDGTAPGDDAPGASTAAGGDPSADRDDNDSSGNGSGGTDGGGGGGGNPHR